MGARSGETRLAHDERKRREAEADENARENQLQAAADELKPALLRALKDGLDLRLSHWEHDKQLDITIYFDGEEIARQSVRL